jgi:hypothetical protein
MISRIIGPKVRVSQVSVGDCGQHLRPLLGLGVEDSDLPDAVVSPFVVAADHMLARGLDAVILRPTAIYGPGDPERLSADLLAYVLPARLHPPPLNVHRIVRQIVF